MLIIKINSFYLPMRNQVEQIMWQWAVICIHNSIGFVDYCHYDMIELLWVAHFAVLPTLKNFINLIIIVEYLLTYRPTPEKVN